MALMRLPTDVLYKIASHTVAPEFVVAAGKNVEVRTALRKGTDAAERSRFGGIGTTIQEAQYDLLTRYSNIIFHSELESREAAGRALKDKCMYSYSTAHPDYEEDIEWVTGRDFFVPSRLIRTMLAYGASPTHHDYVFRSTPLHRLVEYAPPNAVDLARLLLAAGADIDAECNSGLSVGRTPLSWCLKCLPTKGTRYELAIFLIEHGCDVVKANASYQRENAETLLELLEYHESLESWERTPAYMRLFALIATKLDLYNSEL